MTGLLHEKEFSRRQFVKGGGALIVGFSVLGAAGAGKAHASDSPFASNGPYDQYQIDSWIVVNADNTASIKSGSIFQGTGSTDGTLMIAAEELDMDRSQVMDVQADTNVTPQTGVKDASDTINGLAGHNVRAAAAHARLALLGLASAQLGVPASSLSVKSGVVTGGGKSISYGDLLGGKLFNVRLPANYDMQNPARFAATGLLAGQAPAKPVSEYTVVGSSPPRMDIPGIVTGTSTYIHNVRVPGMLHGRIVRPRGQAVYGFGTPIISVDESSIKHLPTVRIVRKGDFLGVVAPHEYDAIQAAAQLKVKWADPPAVLPGGGDEFAHMRALDAAGKTVVSNPAPTSGNVDAALASAAHTVSGTYAWPTNVHTPIGPMAAVADVTPEGARIFSGTQGVYYTRDAVAPLLGLPVNKVRVTAFPMGGCYGDGCQYVDVAAAAGLMSQLAGAPVRVILMRWDEIGWGGTTPGSLMDIRAGIDDNGNLTALDYSQIYPQYVNRLMDTPDQQPNGTADVTGEAVGAPLRPSSIAGNQWGFPIYTAPNNRYTLRSIPLIGNWVKADWMRHGSRPHAYFAGEQVMDELARAANMDPVAFRIKNVTQGPATQSLLAMMSAVTKAAGWQPRVSASSLLDKTVVTGRGFSLTPPAAAIADISVNKKTGKITVKHVYQAFSTGGLLIYPGDVENQNFGGITQILSRLLLEQYRFTKTNVTSLDFVSYPILRFKDAPNITPIVIQRMINDDPKNMPSGVRGVGQEVTDAAAAAVANAFFDATGVRMRTAPFTPARVRATLKAAGVA